MKVSWELTSFHFSHRQSSSGWSHHAEANWWTQILHEAAWLAFVGWIADCRRIPLDFRRSAWWSGWVGGISAFLLQTNATSKHFEKLFLMKTFLIQFTFSIPLETFKLKFWIICFHYFWLSSAGWISLSLIWNDDKTICTCQGCNDGANRKSLTRCSHATLLWSITKLPCGKFDIEIAYRQVFT